MTASNGAVDPVVDGGAMEADRSVRLAEARRSAVVDTRPEEECCC